MDVVRYPGPVLRRGGKKVETFDATLTQIAGDMLETMYAQRGVGLAAPQVGLELELLVLNPTGDREDRSEEMALVNPEILERKGREFGDEGCLSFPGLYAEVERALRIKVRYQDLDGVVQERVFTDFLARIVQHEVDHLRGVLFVDRLSAVEKLRIKHDLADFERRAAGSRA